MPKKKAVEPKVDETITLKDYEKERYYKGTIPRAKKFIYEESQRSQREIVLRRQLWKIQKVQRFRRSMPKLY
jgi:hypothetical protein